MKRTFALLVCFLMLFGLFPTIVHALPAEQANAIQQLLDDAVRISGTPGVSAAIISDSQQHFINSGHMSRANRNAASMVNAHTLYEIGSLSKAFTAVGILLLEEKGLLFLTDYVEEHLPWFYVMYRNERAAVTVQQLLNHTSGLTNNHQAAPRGEGADMLLRTVEPLTGARLDFAPGSSFSYGNANYNILGLIIEKVTGQSYESFMIEQVFQPLGLYQTFLFHSEAIATGRMAQGHRRVFFRNFIYTAPIYGGMKPTGFIISSSSDMARWMGINLGIVQDIPEIFLRVIETAHRADTAGPSMGGNQFYANGWIINIENGIIGHAGQTPNFTANMLLFPSEGQGVIFLANCISIDFNVAWGIKGILDDDLQQSYSRSARHRTDFFHSIFSISFFIFAIAEFVVGTRNRLKYKPKLTKSKIALTAFFVVLTIVFTFVFLNIPRSMGAGTWDWALVFDWGAISTITMMFILPFSFAASAWQIYTKNPKEVAEKKNKADEI